MASAADVQRLLGGYRSGAGFLVRCPVSSHGRGRGDRSPSLSVKDGERGLLVHCFGGCTSGSVLSALRSLGLVNAAVAGMTLAHPARPLRRPAPDEDPVSIWRSATAVPETLAERYLVKHRGLSPPFASTLRFVPSLKYAPMGLRLPALIAAVQSADDTVIAVQATFLKERDGSKASVTSPRWTFGSLGDGAVRMAEATEALGIAEGTEDALSAQGATGIPCWASLGAPRLDKVAVPLSVRQLHIFGDDDAVGHAAAERAATKHRLAGRAVAIRLPPAPFKDWGDYAKAGQRGGAS